MNLNPHLHVLMVDEVFVDVGANPLFRNLTSMTDAEVASLAESISKKVKAILVPAELLGKHDEIVTNPDCDERFRDHEGLAVIFVTRAGEAKRKEGGAVVEVWIGFRGKN